MTTPVATKDGEFNHLEHVVYQCNRLGKFDVSTRLINVMIKYWTIYER